MNDENVVTLIKDLTAKLSAVAAEFSGRAEQVDAERPPAGAVSRPSSTAAAQRLIDERRARRRFLPEELFHEPAWDMLLALFLAWHENRVMNVKTLVAASDAPVTTSQRWIDHLAKLSLVTRVVDPIDRRRIEVTLSESGRDAVQRYLDSLSA